MCLGITSIGFIATNFCFIYIIFLLKILDSYTYKSVQIVLLFLVSWLPIFGYYFLFYPLITYFEVLCNSCLRVTLGGCFLFVILMVTPPIKISVMS